MIELTKEIIREIFTYKNGSLYWKSRNIEYFSTESSDQDRLMAAWNGRFAGKEAFTSKNTYGYYQGKLFGKLYLKHRIIWMYFYGTIPEDKEIDHINRIKTDNRIENLKLVFHKENTKNQSKRKNNTSGVTGINWSKSHNKWVSRICNNYSREVIGFYEKEDLEKKQKKSFLKEGSFLVSQKITAFNLDILI